MKHQSSVEALENVPSKVNVEGKNVIIQTNNPNLRPASGHLGVLLLVDMYIEFDMNETFYRSQ